MDVDVYFGRRVIDPLLALSFPGVGSYSATNGLLVPPIAFAPGHSLGKPMRLDDRETEYVPDDAQCESAPLTSLKKAAQSSDTAFMAKAPSIAS